MKILRITPRDHSDMPLPSHFTYYLELGVQLKSLPRAVLHVRFERRDRVTGQWIAVAPAIRRPVRPGLEKVLLSSAPIAIDDSALQGSALRVVASLRGPRGKELSYSQSDNALNGTLTLRPNSAAPAADKIDLLAATPASNTLLQAGTTTTFVIRFYYSIRSVRQAFVNVEFGDVVDLKQGVCWYAHVISLPQGTGIAEVRIRRFFPAFAAGKTIGISLPLRLAPLGPSVSLIEVKPFVFQKAGP